MPTGIEFDRHRLWEICQPMRPGPHSMRGARGGHPRTPEHAQVREGGSFYGIDLALRYCGNNIFLIWLEKRCREEVAKWLLEEEERLAPAMVFSHEFLGISDEISEKPRKEQVLLEDRKAATAVPGHIEPPVISPRSWPGLSRPPRCCLLRALTLGVAGTSPATTAGYVIRNDRHPL